MPNPYVPIILTQEKISTDGYTSGEPIYFAWNNWSKPLAWGRPESHRSAKPPECTATLHVTFPQNTSLFLVSSTVGRVVIHLHMYSKESWYA